MCYFIFIDASFSFLLYGFDDRKYVISSLFFCWWCYNVFWQHVSAQTMSSSLIHFEYPLTACKLTIIYFLKNFMIYILVDRMYVQYLVFSLFIY